MWAVSSRNTQQFQDHYVRVASLQMSGSVTSPLPLHRSIHPLSIPSSSNSVPWGSAAEDISYYVVNLKFLLHILNIFPLEGPISFSFSFSSAPRHR